MYRCTGTHRTAPDVRTAEAKKLRHAELSSHPEVYVLGTRRGGVPGSPTPEGHLRAVTGKPCSSPETWASQQREPRTMGRGRQRQRGVSGTGPRLGGWPL